MLYDKSKIIIVHLSIISYHRTIEERKDSPGIRHKYWYFTQNYQKLSTISNKCFIQTTVALKTRIAHINKPTLIQ